MYQRLENNNKNAAKECVQNNQLLSSGQLNNVMHVAQQHLLILPFMCSTQTIAE